ncbi:SH2 domain-containing protein 3C-like isoform X2 [Phyllopteryx taeniolatus]|uniref:SH2 domain-containing protein 3C-like isoform X2 n=1 Tax=Phyllopteryx taeniolatus TaxID=161469 RepID=UPI002AD1F72A|nr:SH2 domain-containing protein 3C-like isoform X2 [Phyllopteryx taeniolatus]
MYCSMNRNRHEETETFLRMVGEPVQPLPPAASPQDGSRTWAADDKEAGPQPWGYARSGAMYTHVGTVPCRDRQQSRINMEEEEEWEQATAADHVRDSPLLTALSSLSLNTLEWPSCAPAPPDGYQGAPAPQDMYKGAPAALDVYKITPAPQDLYVHMDAVTDAVRTHKTTKTLQEVEHLHSPSDTTDEGSEYVKDTKASLSDVPFPQSRCRGDQANTPVWRLCLLRPHWHPPRTPSVDANCGSRRELLLVVVWLSVGLLTMMSSKFSKDKKLWLEKQLQEELKLSAANLKSHAWYHGPIPGQVSESLVVNKGDFLIRDSESSPGDFVLTARWDQKTTHFPVQATVVRYEVHYSLDQEVFDSLPAMVRFYTGSRGPLTRRSTARIHRPVNRTVPLCYLEKVFGPPPCQRTTSQAEEVCPKSPSSLLWRDHHQPERSSSTDDISDITLQSVRNLDHSLPEPDQDTEPPDSDSSCYTELYPGPQSYVERLRAEEGPRAVDVFLPPAVETVSSFTPTSYCSPLMPGENKPLEVGILQRVKELLAGADPQTAAQHITKWDCTVARILDVQPEAQRMMGVSSGVELLTLPHGQQLRLDLLERLHTMATMLAVNVLGCTGTIEERACVLDRMIGIAAELKSNMGNMFGFSAVMRALELPQVTRLEQTWTALRQRHTEDAVLYEKTLRPFMKSLNEGRESCPASGTTFPHVLPLLCLLEKSAAVGEGADEREGGEAREMAEAGVDVDVLMFHLAAARSAAHLGAVYAANARNKLQDFQEQSDISEVFRTDFQMRLLWGSRGAVESQVRRYAKFNQVLSALSNRLEPPLH